MSMNKQTIVTTQRVLVLWADGKSPNLGVQVLGSGAQALAESVWGGHTNVSLQDFAGTQTGVAMGAKAILREFFGRSRRIRDFLVTHDVVLDTGAGDSFTDIYGYKRMLTIFAIQRYALRLGLPVVMLPQTIGPFNTVVGKFLARLQLKRVTVVMSRDPKSTDIASALGRAPDISSSDLVFALPLVEATESYDVLFNVSGLLWNANRHVDSVEYRQAVRDLVQQATDAGRRVTLFAHVVNGAANDDDVAAIQALESDLGAAVDVVVPESLEQARQIIAGANIVVGARMHACLNALSLGVPTIPWAYSRKFEPLLSQLGWPHLMDLRDSRDPAAETLMILSNVEAAELKHAAVEVGRAGRDALQLTAEGLRRSTE